MLISFAKKNLTLTIAFVSIFAISLILRVWFNFFDSHVNAAFAFDAAEYLRNAQSIDSTLSRFSEEHCNLWLCFKVLTHCAAPNEIKQVKDIFTPLQGMSISGPVFPLFLLFSYKLFGKSPSFDYWMIPIAVQCLFTSLIPVLLMSIGNKCWNKQAGIIAGLLAAVYPGFIIGSSRLYSESFACFLICLVLWLISSYFIDGRNNFKNGFLLGISLFALQMTRSIMGILSLAVIVSLVVSCFLITSSNRRLILKYLLAVLAGLSICLLPWLAIQKLALGKTSFVTDRCSNYNLFIGNDVDGLGWLSIPYQDCSKLDQENYAHIMKRAFSNSPGRWFKLMLDKPIRLFKLPWNDFKTNIGIISPFVQTIFHQIILVLAFIGLISSNLDVNDKTEYKKIIARLTILSIFLLHLIYLLFITLPRYALTAMPEVLLFAGAGVAIIINGFQSKQTLSTTIKLLAAGILLVFFSKLNLIRALVPLNTNNFMLTQSVLYLSILLKLIVACLFFRLCWQMFIQTQCSKENHQQKISYNIPTSLLVTILVMIFTLPAYCFPLRAHGRWYEWSQPFDKAGQKVERIITINKSLANKLSKMGAYLAINLESGANLSTIVDLQINNIHLDNPMAAAMSMFQNLDLVKLNENNQLTVEQEFIFHCLSNVSSISPLDLRQWYLIPIKGDQWKQIINASQSYESKPNQNKDNLTLDIVFSKKVDSKSTLYGTYPVNRNFSIIPSASHFSWEKGFYSEESEGGLNDPSYDEKIAQNKFQAQSSSAQSKQTFIYPGMYLKLLIPKSNSLTIENIDQQCKETESNCTISFKSKLKPEFATTLSDLYLIRLKGELELVRRGNPIPEVTLHFSETTKQKNKQSYLSYAPVWLPTHLIKQNSKYESFDFCFPILLSAFTGHLDSIELRCTNNEVGNLEKTIRNLNLKCCLQIYQMPKPLSGEHYEIF